MKAIINNMMTRDCYSRFAVGLVICVTVLTLHHENSFSQGTKISADTGLYRHTKIAFTAERNGNFDIYVMNIDGSDLKRLTCNKDWDEKPRWSPDGRKIAFMSVVSDTIADRHWEVYVMNSDGSDQRRLTFDRRVNANPWWSPDGEKIVFNSEGDDGISAIYIMSADGSQQKRLTGPGGRPSWSGNGKQIAFISFTDETSDISVINTDGTGEKNLTNSAAPDGTPSFSPDGSKIAFLSVVDGHYEIFVMNSDGRELKRLTYDSVASSSPSWSPDGEKIIFQRGMEDDTEIYIMNADGSEQKRLTNNNSYDGLPAWSPFLNSGSKNLSTSKIIYRNPRVYNVDYTFELCPDKDSIDPSKDLKLWIPIPREWDSQKAVKIFSVNPPPHAEYEDPEHGNRMLFWDFGKETEKPSYRVDIKFRLESYETHAEVYPELVGQYDKSSKQYALYTRSSHTVTITPRIREMAQEAVGDEKNPYLQVKRILQFVRKKMFWKIHRHDRGVGTRCLLDFPVTDNETGEVYYEGSCEQYSALFIALCRAVGIPARTVAGFVYWLPWKKEEDLEIFNPIELELSPDGLAAAQHYMALWLHTWAEFYLPNYGWIPADPDAGRLDNLDNRKLIISKARDVQIGPQAQVKHSEGYGTQWIILNNGRVDLLRTGIFNISKIRTAKVKILHHSDPFPADGLANYSEKTCPKEDEEKNLRHWRKGVLSSLSRHEPGSIPDSLNLEQFYNNYPDTKYEREAFVCHMLRRQLGDEKFYKLVRTYLDLRQKSNQPVSTTRFRELAEDVYGEPMDWFFSQWINNTELPRLKLENVTAEKDNKGWQVHGRLIQSGKTSFRLPVELAVDTKNGREIEKLCIDSRAVDFDLRTQNEPQRLMVDPDYEILKIQRMPPRLVWFWDVYPKYILIFGTIAEAESNRTAAERFNDDYLGLGKEIIKADTVVCQDDLINKCVFLFGRSETNKISQQFKDIFPIKIDKDKFTWQGITYDQPSQGVAQIVENPLDPESVIVLYTGLSGEATQKFGDLYLYDTDASFVIFDRDKQLLSGDWELDGVDSDLVWTFELHALDQQP